MTGSCGEMCVYLCYLRGVVYLEAAISDTQIRLTRSCKVVIAGEDLNPSLSYLQNEPKREQARHKKHHSKLAHQIVGIRLYLLMEF